MGGQHQPDQRHDPGELDPDQGAAVGEEIRPYTPDGPRDLTHNKILITDATPATGSYDFSANAEKNAENQVHLSHDPTLLAAYTDYLTTITTTNRSCPDARHSDQRERSTWVGAKRGDPRREQPSDGEERTIASVHAGG